ncbi:MAG: hypothetical protein K0R14_2014 [Burkholderiales bacterium]|jgi:hypothetical protein|nr:hypothetical protein [Burkholderiales bacterium]
MKKYTVVKPENYTEEHVKYINQFKDSISLLSVQTNLMLGLKDTTLKFITGTDTSAKTLGLKYGADFTGRGILDIPCDGVAKYAEQINQQEQGLLDTCDISKGLEALSVFEFADGLKARTVTRQLFYYQPSASILGITNSVINVKLKDFINIIPSYILRFGAIGSIEAMQQDTKIENITLNEYEQEICFLFLLGWSIQQVTDFMDIFRPNNTPRTADAIIKKKNYICQKLGLTNTNLKNLCEYLFSIGFQNKMPESFYLKMIGTKIIN